MSQERSRPIIAVIPVIFLATLVSLCGWNFTHRAPSAQAAGRPGGAGGPTTTPSRANILRGEYGRYRANNDLLYYHLDVRVDPAKKSIAGKNTIRFKM